MPSRLQETLKEKVRARHRSSVNLTTRDVLIHMTDKSDLLTNKSIKVLEVEIMQQQDHPAANAEQGFADSADKFAIKLEMITEVKVKNFVEKMTNVYIVAVTCEEEQEQGTLKVQHFLEFESLEKRDDWGNGLRSLHHSFQWLNKRTETKADSKRLHMIKAINLQLPKAGCLVSMEIETAAGKKAELHVADDKKDYSSDACKELTSDFILQNFIIPGEGASLYRFIRSVISRLLMERETTVILGEIDASRFNKVLEARNLATSSKANSANASEVKNALHVVEGTLRDLAGAVPDRIGKHGPSSQLLVDILLRSIEKTKIYNKMAFTINYGDSGGDDAW